MCSRVAGLMKPLINTEATTRSRPEPAPAGSTPAPAAAPRYGSLAATAAAAERGVVVLPAAYTQRKAGVPSSSGISFLGWLLSCWYRWNGVLNEEDEAGRGGSGGRGGRGSHDIMEGEPLTATTPPRPGHDPERDTSSQEDGLLEAASEGNVGRLEHLLARGVDVNVARRGGDYPGWRPLHRAAEAGYAGAVRVLLQAGAKAEARIGEGGPLAAQLAAQGGHLEVLKALLPRMTMGDRFGYTPEWPDSGEAQHPPPGQQLLHLAALGGHVDVLEYLLNQGFEVNAMTTDGRQQTALHVACECLNEAAARWLLQVEDCDVAAEDSRGYRAADIAAEHYSKDLASLLKGAERAGRGGEDHTASPEEADHMTVPSTKRRSGRRRGKGRRSNEHRAQKILPRGLKNLGNTCYMNAVLQCLFHTDKLTTFFLDDDWREYKTKIKRDGEYNGGSGEDHGSRSRDGEQNIGRAEERGTGRSKDGEQNGGSGKDHGIRSRDDEQNTGAGEDRGNSRSKDGEQNGGNGKDLCNDSRYGEHSCGSGVEDGSRDVNGEHNSGKRVDHGSKSRNDEHSGGSGEDRSSRIKVEDQGSRREAEDQGSSCELKDYGGDNAAKDQGGDGAAKDQGGDGAAKDQGGDGAAKDQGGDSAAKDQGGDGAAKDQGGDGAAKDHGSESEFDLSESFKRDEHRISKGVEDESGSKDVQENGSSRDGDNHDERRNAQENGGSKDVDSQGSRRDIDSHSCSDDTLDERDWTSLSPEYHGEVAESYCALVRALKNLEDPEEPLVKFKATVDFYDPSFVGTKQHEAHDLLSFLLDALDRDLQGLGQSLPAQAFFGLHQSTITCKKTKQVISQVEELFTCLSLPVVKTRYGRGQSLQECLKNYYKECTLLWDCPKCCSTHNCVSATVIKKLPKVLIIHLGRVVDSPYDTDKERVRFPRKLKEMNHYTRGEQRREYELYAACYHFGSTLSGHYTASCRTLEDGEAWHHFDDDYVIHQRGGPDVDGAHILFYKSV